MKSRDVGAERPSCVVRVIFTGRGADCDSCVHRDFESCPQGKAAPLWWDGDGKPIYSENHPLFKRLFGDYTVHIDDDAST